MQSFFDNYSGFKNTTIFRIHKLEKELLGLEGQIRFLEEKLKTLEHVWTELPPQIAAELQIRSGQFGYTFQGEGWDEEELHL